MRIQILACVPMRGARLSIRRLIPHAADSGVCSSTYGTRTHALASTHTILRGQADEVGA